MLAKEQGAGRAEIHISCLLGTACPGTERMRTMQTREILSMCLALSTAALYLSQDFRSTEEGELCAPDSLLEGNAVSGQELRGDASQGSKHGLQMHFTISDTYSSTYCKCKELLQGLQSSRFMLSV